MEDIKGEDIGQDIEGHLVSAKLLVLEKQAAARVGDPVVVLA